MQLTETEQRLLNSILEDMFWQKMRNIQQTQQKALGFDLFADRTDREFYAAVQSLRAIRDAVEGETLVMETNEFDPRCQYAVEWRVVAVSKTGIAVVPFARNLCSCSWCEIQEPFRYNGRRDRKTIPWNRIYTCAKDKWFVGEEITQMIDSHNLMVTFLP